MNELPTESSHLLHHPVINDSEASSPSESPQCKHLCLPSKAAVLILFWTAVVGTVYNVVLILAAVIADTWSLSPDISISANYYLPYAILAFVSMLYPLSGFVADVYCGRLKAVLTGLCLIFTFILLLCLVEILVLIKPHSLGFYEYSVTVHYTEGIMACILIALALLVFVIGLVGYQANVIQLGLDQLFEAPSQYLSLFILYAVWALELGSLPIITVIPLFLCALHGPVNFVAIGVLA